MSTFHREALTLNRYLGLVVVEDDELLVLDKAKLNTPKSALVHLVMRAVFKWAVQRFMGVIIGNCETRTEALRESRRTRERKPVRTVRVVCSHHIMG